MFEAITSQEELNSVIKHRLARAKKVWITELIKDFKELNELKIEYGVLKTRIKKTKVSYPGHYDKLWCEKAKKDIKDFEKLKIKVDNWEKKVFKRDGLIIWLLWLL